MAPPSGVKGFLGTLAQALCLTTLSSCSLPGADEGRQKWSPDKEARAGPPCSKLTPSSSLQTFL